MYNETEDFNTWSAGNVQSDTYELDDESIKTNSVGKRRAHDQGLNNGNKKQRLQDSSPSEVYVNAFEDPSANAFSGLHASTSFDTTLPPFTASVMNDKPVKEKEKDKDGKTRALRACDSCRKNKSRCEAVEGDDGTACRRCKSRNTSCTFDMPATRRKTDAEKEANKRNRAAAAASQANLIQVSAPGASGSLSAFPGQIDSTLGIQLSTILGKQPATEAELQALASLRDAVAHEEAEAERLQLLVKYKTLHKNNEMLRGQLEGISGVTTPPELKAPE